MKNEFYDLKKSAFHVRVHFFCVFNNFRLLMKGFIYGPPTAILNEMRAHQCAHVTVCMSESPLRVGYAIFASIIRRTYETNGHLQTIML